MRSDNAVLDGQAYAYNNVGIRRGVTDVHGVVTTWTYDEIYQLTDQLRAGAANLDWETFSLSEWEDMSLEGWATFELGPWQANFNIGDTYDAAGNRLVSNSGGALTTYTYDAANQLETSHTTAGVTTYTYDAAGNLRFTDAPGNQRTTYTWNVDNRQTKVELPSGGITTNIYRADGLRHQKEDSTGTTRFVYDGQAYLAETDGSNVIRAVYTNEPAAYGGLVSQRRHSDSVWTPSYYHFDAVGSARGLTDATQNMVASYLQNAFGGSLNSSSLVNPFRFVGQVGYYFDENTGLFNVRQRVYDSTLARWISEDPIQSDDNRFRYAGNSPLNSKDPSGLVLIAFDGTDNTPESDTNVRRFYDMYQGHKQYISGVGTGEEGVRGSMFGRSFSGRIENMHSWLEEYLSHPGAEKEIDIVGFSRGAAQARIFAHRIEPLLLSNNARIRFIGVWDTVFALGVGPHVGVTSGTLSYKQDVPSYALGRAFHAMAIDEDRDLFALTRYPGAREVWFPGAHSDVGGGYPVHERGFANEAFRWMLWHARKCGVPINQSTDTTPLELGNSRVHNAMDESYVMWLGNFRKTRTIPAQDMIHASVIWSHLYYRRTMSEDAARKAFQNLYPKNVINDDNGWIQTIRPWASRTVVTEVVPKHFAPVQSRQVPTIPPPQELAPINYSLPFRREVNPLSIRPN